MNELNNLMGAESHPVELSDIVGEPLSPINIPEASVRNRAAVLSMFSKTDEEAVEQFGMMMGEKDTGDYSYTNLVESKVAESISQEDRETFMSILSDPSVSFEQKQKAIDRLKLGPFTQEPSVGLITKMASEESKGETFDVEAARIGSVSRSINEINRSNEIIQGMVNAHAAGLDTSSTVANVVDIVEAWVAPLAPNQLNATLQGKLNDNRTWGEKLKSFFDPGRDIVNMRERLANLPPKQRVEFTQQILDAIGSNPNNIFASKNQFAEYEKLTQLFETDGYDETDVWLERVATVLDVVGLGFAVRQTARGAKATKTIPSVTKGPDTPVTVTTPDAKADALMKEADSVPTSYDLRIRPQTADEVRADVAAQNQGRIASLEEERAALLGEEGKALDKGQVSQLRSEIKNLERQRLTSVSEEAARIQKSRGITSKAAKEQAAKFVSETNAELDARIARLQGQIEGNASATRAAQRIAEIDSDLAVLRKNESLPSRLNPIADLVRRIEGNQIVAVRNPSSPKELAHISNPQKARDIHETLLNSQTDAMSEAVAGTNKAEALISDVIPQMATASQRVTVRANDIERNVRLRNFIPDKIKEYIWGSGRIDLTPAEKPLADKLTGSN